MIRLYYFFDTIVHRRCTSDEIKRVWAQRLVSRLGLPCEYERLYGIRRKEEIYLAKNKKPYGEFSYSELSGRIYNSLIYAPELEEVICRLSCGEFIDICLDEEIKTELKYQYLDKHIISEIVAEKEKGCGIYIVSDFYLDASVFRRFLSHHNIEKLFDDIFISCDCGLNKHSGTLYQYVTGRIGVRADECIMTGDNYRSDYLMAKKVGMDAVCTGYKADGESVAAAAAKKLLSIEAHYKTKYGNYANYGIQMFLFADRLYKALKRSGHKRVYFFSREGEMLKKLFEIYLSVNGISDMDTAYLYVSRKATYAPTLKPLDTEDFNVIFREYPDISLSGLVKNLGFSAEDIAACAASCRLDFDITIKDLAISEQFKELKADKCFVSIYDTKRREQREAFGKYLEQNGIGEGTESIAVVDVGWKGTIQDNIYRFFGGRIKTDGYYLGLHSGGDTCRGNYKFGLLFSVLPDETYMYDEMSWDKTWYERLMYASHASTEAYTIEDGKARPVLKGFESERHIYDEIKPIQDRVTECFKSVCELFRDADCPRELVRDTFTDIYLRVLFKEKTSFLKLQNKLSSSQFENFGYNTSQSDVERERFRLSNMWRKRAVIAKAIKEFGRTNSVGTICHVLELKKLYFASQLIYRYVYRIRKKKFERLKAYEQNGKYYSPRL